jgi:hypothetical protein
MFLHVVSDESSNYRVKAFEVYQTRLREEHRPRVFENRVLRRIMGREREEVASR